MYSVPRGEGVYSSESHPQGLPALPAPSRQRCKDYDGEYMQCAVQMRDKLTGFLFLFFFLCVCVCVHAFKIWGGGVLKINVFEQQN